MKPAAAAPTLDDASGLVQQRLRLPAGSALPLGSGELRAERLSARHQHLPPPVHRDLRQRTTCQNGVCVIAPCVGPMCSTTTMPPGGVTVTGTYDTFLPVRHPRLRAEGRRDRSAARRPQRRAQRQTRSAARSRPRRISWSASPSSFIAQNIHAPPWGWGQLIQLLSGVFKFGDTPVTAKGVMQLAEASDGTLSAAETWSEMWLEYDATVYNVMNSPSLGTNGNISVTVKAYGGVRTTNEVILGPRDINFDVNKLLVNLINVAISAGSNNQAHDVGELFGLVLCDQLHRRVERLLAVRGGGDPARQSVRARFGAGRPSSRGAARVIYDDDNDGKADAFGRDIPVSARGSLRGSMSNGLVDGDLGPFPQQQLVREEVGAFSGPKRTGTE